VQHEERHQHTAFLAYTRERHYDIEGRSLLRACIGLEGEVQNVSSHD